MAGRFTVSRRAALEGLGFGAVGLGAAALIGCGGGGAKQTGQIAAGKSGQVTGAISGGGMPLNAPVVKGTIREGGTYLGGSSAANVQHDPHTQLGGSEWDMISEKGLNCDPVTAELRPAVFTSWEVADPSGLTLVFKVSDKLFMAPADRPPFNGRQFDAQDAAWNLERIGGLYAQKTKIPLANFQRASMVDKIVKAQAVDKTTVRVTLSAPNSAFFNGLWDTRVMFAPKEMDDVGWTDPLKFAGPGAWIMKEFVPNVRTAYVKNPRYTEFRKGEPHFDQTRSDYISDATASQSNFISGQQVAIGVGAPDVLKTIRQGRPDANLYTWVNANWGHLRFGMRYAPFKDYRVRQAFHLATDYKASADSSYGLDGGWAYQASLNPGFPEAWSPDKVKAIAGYNPDTKKADIAEALKLLTAAGYPNGKGLQFDITPSSPTSEYGLHVQSYWSEAFPDAKITHTPLGPGAAFANAQAEARFDMVAYGITCAPDAYIEMQSQYATEGSRNYGKFSNPALDVLIDKTAGELNKDARKKLFDDFQQKWITDWRPMIVLHADATKTMVQGNIGGYEKSAGPWHGYRSTQEIRNRYLVDNGINAYKG